MTESMTAIFVNPDDLVSRLRDLDKLPCAAFPDGIGDRDVRFRHGIPKPLLSNYSLIPPDN
jgi:hypothetical protein